MILNEHFAFDDLASVCRWLSDIHGGWSKSHVAAAAKPVCLAADAGNRKAQACVQAAAGKMAQRIADLIAWHADESPPVLICGALAARCDTYKKELTFRLERRVRTLQRLGQNKQLTSLRFVDSGGLPALELAVVLGEAAETALRKDITLRDALAPTPLGRQLEVTDHRLIWSSHPVGTLGRRRSRSA